jgi:hypothetical protein
VTFAVVILHLLTLWLLSVCPLVDRRSFAVKGFWALHCNICECVCCYRCHSNAVKGCWPCWMMMLVLKGILVYFRKSDSSS